MKLTYQELLNRINKAAVKNPAILNQDVTIYDVEGDEYYAANKTDVTVEDDVLDGGHFVIVLN